MEPQSCVCRNVRKQDYRKIENLIIKAWEYEEWCESKLYGRLIAKAYLNYFLSKQTMAKVIEYNDEIVAVMMGRCERLFKKRKVIKHIIKMYIYAFILSFIKDGIEQVKSGSLIEKANKKLCDEVKKQFDGELVLLIVDEKMRGKKLGNNLLKRFIAYMEKYRAKDFYILTDTTCNYQFYERPGFKRLNEKQIYIPIEEKKEDFFLYQCNVKTI